MTLIQTFKKWEIKLSKNEKKNERYEICEMSWICKYHNIDCGGEIFTEQ